LSSLAYVLMCAVRRIGLPGTALERATCGTLRLQLLKIGALVTISVRRVKLAFASACPSRSRTLHAISAPFMHAYSTVREKAGLSNECFEDRGG
jgi:hypothetical protein